ncbi:cytochrome P450 [Pseudomassariella vexata]|uniref:Cytochrome P450 n=1 Tax=Pseudomassariella vexata TaxID=1141098 RepID=A0A1Y2DXP2_9PEZI|nr:cytochrome P450 [Pseudomassariella vexata]ORY64013.1 cytochrome P450 [Pseudomassariella vexata]
MFARLTTGTLAGDLAILVLTIVVFLAGLYAISKARKEAKVRKLGVRAYSVGNNPISATRRFMGFKKSQAEDRTIEFYDKLFSRTASGNPNLNVVELEITPSHRFIFTRDPEVIKTVLGTKFWDFGKGPDFHRLWKAFLGNSLITTDGDLWNNSRRLIRPMFTKDRVSDLEIFERKTRLLIDQLPTSGETVQLMDLVYRMVLDVSTEFLLGTSVNSLIKPNNEFAHALDEIQKIQMQITTSGPFEIFIGRKTFHRHIRTIESFVVPFIQTALALPSQELEKTTRSDKSFTFLHQILQYTRDPEVVRDHIMAVLFAGRDSIAATLSWAFYELSAYPEIWTKLRSEVLSTIGPTKAPTYADLRELKYLRFTLQETLRLYPAIPYNMRTAVTDTTLPGQPDIGVCKGDNIIYLPIMMQRRQDLYPPASDRFADPAVFSPERWYGWQPRSQEFIPFNAGPRICVGQNFAMAEMAYFMVRILQKYERIEYRGDWGAQIYKADIVGRPKLGVPVAFYKARVADST